MSRQQTECKPNENSRRQLKERSDDEKETLLLLQKAPVRLLERKDFLNNYGIQSSPSSADGDCFFHSVLTNPVVNAEFGNSRNLRRRFGEYLKDNRQNINIKKMISSLIEISSRISGEDAFPYAAYNKHIKEYEDWAEAMSQEGVWADNVAVIAMCSFLNKMIVIYDNALGYYNIYAPCEREYNGVVNVAGFNQITHELLRYDPTYTIIVIYNGANHYDGIVTKERKPSGAIGAEAKPSVKRTHEDISKMFKRLESLEISETSKKVSSSYDEDLELALKLSLDEQRSKEQRSKEPICKAKQRYNIPSAAGITQTSAPLGRYAQMTIAMASQQPIMYCSLHGIRNCKHPNCITRYSTFGKKKTVRKTKKLNKATKAKKPNKVRKRVRINKTRKPNKVKAKKKTPRKINRKSKLKKHNRKINK